MEIASEHRACEVEGVIGVLGGHTLALVGIGTLIVFATGAATATLQAFLGVAGTAFAIVLLVAIGNPASGGVFPTGMLAHPWRDVGPLLPPGAGTTLVRNITYFEGNAISGPVLVLLAYAVVGALAFVLASGRRRTAASPEA